MDPSPPNSQPYLPNRDNAMARLPSELFHTPARFSRGGLVFAAPSLDDADLSQEQLRWCGYELYRVRALVAIEHLNPIDDPRLRSKFDRLVALCQNMRGTPRAAIDGAKRDLEAQRAGIILDTFREGRLLEGYPWFPPNPYLKSGPEQIKEVQAGLRTLGYRTGEPDGIAGGRTEAAVKAFQRDAGIPQSGVIDQNLRTLVGMASRVAGFDYY